MNNGFHWLDTLVIILYFFGITGYGLWLTRKIKNSDSFFRGERKFSWWIMMGQAFGAGTHAENFVAQTGASFQLGFASIWYQWKNMVITPFYWLIAPWYRRSERTTVSEIVEDLYGRKLSAMYTVFAILFFIFAQGVMLKGAAKVISVASGNMISSNGIVIGMTLAFVIYSFFGGLIASAYANFIQALMIIVLSFMLIPSGLLTVGGYEGMRAALPADFFNLYNSKVGLSWFTIVMLAINGIVGITAQPHMVSMCATGATERAGRVGMTYGSFVKRFATIGWALTGLIVATLVIQNGLTLDDPEKAFGYATRELLWPGFTGLMLASVLAANMSSCSNFMVNTGALFTQNFYKEYLNKKASDKNLLTVGRFSSLGLTALGVVFAIYISNVLHAFLFMETTAAFIGIIIFGGILWKRANSYGAWAAVILSFTVYYILNFSSRGSLELVYNWNTVIFAWSMFAGFAGFILVSLITKPENTVRKDKFFNKMQLPSDIIDASSKGDEGKTLILLDAFPGWFTRERWRDFLKRYREDWLGFILAWLFVIILIAIAWLILQF